MAKVYSKVNWGTNTQVGFEPLDKMDNAIDILDTKMSGDFIHSHGTNHLQYDNGRMDLEWDVTVIPDASGKATIGFPVPFVSATDLFVFTQLRFSNSPSVYATVGAITPTGFDIYIYNGSTPFSQTQMIHILAKGRWK